jgi:hypothetical protein
MAASDREFDNGFSGEPDPPASMTATQVLLSPSLNTWSSLSSSPSCPLQARPQRQSATEDEVKRNLIATQTELKDSALTFHPEGAYYLSYSLFGPAEPQHRDANLTQAKETPFLQEKFDLNKMPANYFRAQPPN